MPWHGAFAQTLQLSLPLDCEPGKNCFIQNYVDMEPSAGVLDYACGAATYDGHKGTDIRLLSTVAAQQDFTVRAAASGVVKGLRDGMPDVLVTTPAQRQVLKGRECGNGVVIDHGKGWETQYCHLRRGSVRVRKGERIERGARLGFVGYSGLAAFAHVHLAVRYKGRIVDPFIGTSPEGSCDKSTLNGLWGKGVFRDFPYHNGTLISLGFTDRSVSIGGLEDGSVSGDGVDRASQKFIFYVRFMNLLKGDSLQLELEGPAGIFVKNKVKPLGKNKAHYVSYLGKKRRAALWSAGRYQGSVRLIRDGKTLITQSAELDLQ